jgi:hypothetical protein
MAFEQLLKTVCSFDPRDFKLVKTVFAMSPICKWLGFGFDPTRGCPGLGVDLTYILILLEKFNFTIAKKN